MFKTPRERIKDLYQVEDDIQFAEERLKSTENAGLLEELQRMRDERQQRVPHIRAEIVED